jgi:hypothetical protein
MPHTQSRYQQDLGFTDGKVFVGAQQLLVNGTAALTRTAAGNWNYAQGNSQTVEYAVNVSDLVMRRLGFFEDLQEQFGGGGIAGSAQIRTYRPDVIGSMNTGQQLQPRTAFKTKGFRVTGYNVIYAIAGANLTAHTTRVDTLAFVNNTAPSAAAILASGVNGLSVVVQAQPYVTVVSIANAVYFTTNNADYIIEVQAQTPGGGTYVLYGIDVSLEFNFN